MYGFVGSEVDWTVIDSANDIVGGVMTNTITNLEQHPDVDKSDYYKCTFNYTWDNTTFPSGVYSIQIVERNVFCSSEVKILPVYVHELPVISDPIIQSSIPACSDQKADITIDAIGSTLGGLLCSIA